MHGCRGGSEVDRLDVVLVMFQRLEWFDVMLPRDLGGHHFKDTVFECLHVGCP